MENVRFYLPAYSSQYQHRVFQAEYRKATTCQFKTEGAKKIRKVDLHPTLKMCSKIKSSPAIGSYLHNFEK